MGGSSVGLGVLMGKTLSVVGAAVARSVGDGSALSVVGAVVALRVGDGAAPSVVGGVVVCSEDAMPSVSPVAPSESGRSVGSAVARSDAGASVGSSEPPQASSSNGRSNIRAESPRNSLGIVMSIHSTWGWGLLWLGRGRSLFVFAEEWKDLDEVRLGSVVRGFGDENDLDVVAAETGFLLGPDGKGGDGLAGGFAEEDGPLSGAVDVVLLDGYRDLGEDVIGGTVGRAG